MPQIGSENKPVLMSSKKNRGRIGKGSRQRPINDVEKFNKNWDLIFSKGSQTKEQS
jgi:hypothetical protein